MVLAESVTKLIATWKVDNLTTSDSSHKNVSLLMEETTHLSDVENAKSSGFIGEHYSDTLYLSDSLTKSISVVKSDVIVAQEVPYEKSIHLQDILTITDKVEMTKKFWTTWFWDSLEESDWN